MAQRALVLLGAGAACVLAYRVTRQLAFWASLRLGPARLKQFKGETALITGASYGIGRALAQQVAGQGINVVLVARSQGKLHALAEEVRSRHSVQAHTIVADLARPGAADEVVRQLPPDCHVSLLICNAGGAPDKGPAAGEWWKGDQQAAQYVQHLNGESVYGLMRALLPGMLERRKGLILGVSSMMVHAPAYCIPYAAEKAKLECLLIGLADELQGTGVTAQALQMGPVLTPGTDKLTGVEEGSRKPSLLSPSADTAARHMLRVAGKGPPVVRPYWPHAALAWLVSHMPALRRAIGKQIKGMSEKGS